MMARSITLMFALLIVVTAGVGLMSCTKLDSTTPMEGALAFKDSQFEDAIPADYGRVVGVTRYSADSRWVAVWFEKPDQSIAIVWVNPVEGKIGEKVAWIPRK